MVTRPSDIPGAHKQGQNRETQQERGSLTGVLFRSGLLSFTLVSKAKGLFDLSAILALTVLERVILLRFLRAGSSSSFLLSRESHLALGKESGISRVLDVAVNVSIVWRLLVYNKREKNS